LTCLLSDLNIKTIMNEAHTTDNQLHDLIVPTVGEHYNEDDHYGTPRYFDEYDMQDDNNTEALNEWGEW